MSDNWISIFRVLHFLQFITIVICCKECHMNSTMTDWLTVRTEYLEQKFYGLLSKSTGKKRKNNADIFQKHTKRIVKKGVRK